MTECTQGSFVFAAHFSRRVMAQFDGAWMTSDGGGLLLRRTNRKIHLLERVAAGGTFACGWQMWGLAGTPGSHRAFRR